MRRRTKGLIYLAVIVCVLVVGTLIVFRTQGERIAIKLGDFLTSQVGRERNLTIEVGNITGSVVRDLRLEDLLVSYTGGERPVILLSATSVYAKFSLPALLLGRIEIDSLAIESPNLVVPRRPDGSRIYLSGDAPGGPPGKPVNLRVDHFAVKNASVNWQGEKRHRLSRFRALGSLTSREGDYRLVLNDAGFRYGRTFTVTQAGGSVEIMKDGFRIDSLSVATPASRLTIWGSVGGEENDSLNLTAAIDSLGLREIPAIMDGEPHPGLGSLSGRINIGGALSKLVIQAELEGDVLGWPLEGLRAGLAYGEDALDLERLSAIYNGVALDLSCEYTASDPPRYKGVVAFNDLDLSRFARNGSSGLDSDLNGTVRFDGKGITSESFSLDAWPRLEPGRYRDWPFDWARGKVEVSAVDVVLDSVSAGISDTEVTADGRIGYDGSSGLAFTYDIPDLGGISAYHGLDSLVGSIRGQASLATDLGETVLEAQASGGDIGFRGTKVGSVDLNVALTESGDSLRGEGHVLGRELDLMGVKGKELIGDFSLSNNTVDIDRLVLTRPDGSLVGVVGALDIEKQGFDLVLRNVFVETAGFIWENVREIPVSYREDSLSVGEVVLDSEMGRVSIRRLTYDGHVFDVESAVRDFDLDLLRTVTGKEMPSGILNVDLTASGKADSLTFEIGFKVASGEIRSIDFQSLTGTVRYDGARVELDEIALRQNGGSVALTGWIPMDLSPARIGQVVRSGEGYDLVEDLGEISIQVSDVDIALIQPLIPPVAKLKGFANLSMQMSGTKSNPEVVTVGSLRGAVFGETDIGTIQWDIGLKDSVLEVRSLAFGEGDERGYVSGYLPLAVSILPFSSRLLEDAWELDISVENGDLGLLCAVVPRLKVCSGTYAVNLKVGGNVADPTFQGLVELSGARLRVEGVAQDIRDLYLGLSADGKRFDITRMVAEGGALKARGFFELSGVSISQWEVDVTLDHYRVTEFEDLYAQLKGELRIRSELIAPGLSVPRIEGDLVVEEGEYYYVATGEGGGGEIVPPTPTPGWLLDVTVDIPNDFWIRGDLVNAELQGDVSVRRGKEGLLVLGTLRTMRGSFNLYHNSFRISKGEFRFSDVKSFWNAYIELEANTTVLDERIQIAASGQIDQLDITATSESGWTEQQIFEALLLRRGVASEEGEQGGFLSQAFVRSWATALVGRFGDDVARELHLDRFGVEIGEGAEGEALAGTRFTVGKYVYDKVYLEYSQTLGTLYGDRQRITQMGLSFPERQLSVEYRFSDRFSIDGETGTMGGLGYFEVDLKIRYGY